MDVFVSPGALRKMMTNLCLSSTNMQQCKSLEPELKLSSSPVSSSQGMRDDEGQSKHPLLNEIIKVLQMSKTFPPSDHPSNQDPYRNFAIRLSSAFSRTKFQVPPTETNLPIIMDPIQDVPRAHLAFHLPLLATSIIFFVSTIHICSSSNLLFLLVSIFYTNNKLEKCWLGLKAQVGRVIAALAKKGRIYRADLKSMIAFDLKNVQLSLFECLESKWITEPRSSTRDTTVSCWVFFSFLLISEPFIPFSKVKIPVKHHSRLNFHHIIFILVSRNFLIVFYGSDFIYNVFLLFIFKTTTCSASSPKRKPPPFFPLLVPRYPSHQVLASTDVVFFAVFDVEAELAGGFGCLSTCLGCFLFYFSMKIINDESFIFFQKVLKNLCQQDMVELTVFLLTNGLEDTVEDSLTYHKSSLIREEKQEKFQNMKGNDNSFEGRVKNHSRDVGWFFHCFKEVLLNFVKNLCSGLN
ncbi:hypothetical protein VP01_662g3 [Puccinia sorghi]|uniref:Uncharacterized protein n=1 Tax=Puccinia sorghi TaxID=27349 RepID=A0A0L6UF32_9BASI|nr:hypothetical protein VP01_662g3 [Puccinia sorghi]